MNDSENRAHRCAWGGGRTECTLKYGTMTMKMMRSSWTGEENRRYLLWWTDYVLFTWISWTQKSQQAHHTSTYIILLCDLSIRDTWSAPPIYNGSVHYDLFKIAASLHPLYCMHTLFTLDLYCNTSGDLVPPDSIWNF